MIQTITGILTSLAALIAAATTVHKEIRETKKERSKPDPE